MSVLTASIFPLPTHRPTPVLPILGVRPTPGQTQLNPAPARLTGKTSFPPSSDLFPRTKQSRQAFGLQIPQLIPPHLPASSYNSSLSPPGPQTHDWGVGLCGRERKGKGSGGGEETWGKEGETKETPGSKPQVPFRSPTTVAWRGQTQSRRAPLRGQANSGECACVRAEPSRAHVRSGWQGEVGVASWKILQKFRLFHHPN